MKIWHRYLLGQLSLTFFFLLFALFAIYLIVNLSEQGVGLFGSNQIKLNEIIIYYVANFLVLLDFFFPLSFMLASLKVLIDLNSHQELVALQMAGLSKKMILAPFFFFATLLSLFSFLNTEWLAPQAHETVDAFWSAHSKKKVRKEHLHTLPLEDDSELIYQNYDAAKSELYDVIWLRSKNEIWRIANLDMNTKTARQAELLIRRENLWQKENSFVERTMLEMPLNTLCTMQRFIPFENRPIRSLFQQIRSHLPDRVMAQAHFYYKTMRPLLPLFVLFAITPVAMRFKRGRSPFLLIACALAAFFGFMTVLDGMLLIGETRLMPASLAVLSPFAIVFASSFRTFIRL